jgi:hypothetical protein
VPTGRAPAARELASEIREALAGWPIVLLRVVGRAEGRTNLGRHPGRWARRELIAAVDQHMCTCPGLRCTRTDCAANRLLGRHGRFDAPDGEAWAPFAIRATDMPQGRFEERADLKFEVVFAGREAVSAIPGLLPALADPPRTDERGPKLTWTAVHALRLDDEGEMRWKKVDPSGPPPLLPLDDLASPRVRSSRLTLTFLSATPMSRSGERGRPGADFALIADRMTRSLGAWMGRTAHRAPRLPVDNILRTAGKAELVADHSRLVELPGLLLGASGAGAGDDRVPSILGSITWRGEFEGLAPLLRAAHYLGMGPGRQHAIGQVAIR